MTLARLIAVLALLLTVQISFAQDISNGFDPVFLDSALKAAEDDTSKLDILMRLGEINKVSNREVANDYYDQVIFLGKSINAPLFVSEAYMMKGILSRMNSELDSSLHFVSQAITYAEIAKDSSYQIFLLNNKALILSDLDRSFEAANILTSTLNYAKRKKDTNAIFQGITNLATLKGATGDYQGTIEFINEKESIWSLADEHIKARIRYLRGSSYIALRQFKEGISSYQKVYPIFKEIPNRYNFIYLLMNYSEALTAVDSLEFAKRIILEAIKESETINFQMGLNKSRFYLAKLYYTQGKMDSADYYSQIALKNISELELPSMYLATLKLAKDIQSAKGDWKKAKEYGDKYIAVRDSIDKIARIKSMDSLLILNDVKEKEVALSNALNEKQSEAKAKKKVLVFGGIALGLILVLSIWIYFRKHANIKQLASESSSYQVAATKSQEELKNKLVAIANQEKDIQSLKEKVDTLTRQQKAPAEKLAIADIYGILSRNIKKESDWALFEEYFEVANPKFFALLKEQFPKLTSHDLRLLSLIRLNLDPNEIAALFNIAPNSVRKARYRLAKKLELEGEKELHAFVFRI